MSEKGRPRAILPLAVVMASLATLSPTTPSAAILPQIAVRTTPAGEFQPARNQSAFAWEQNSRARPKKYDVMVQPAAGPIAQANSGESSAAMGDFAGDRLVFQQYRGNPYGRGRSDLFFHDLLSGARSRVRGVNTGRWEYWPSASGEWLLFGRWTPTSEVRRLFLNNLDSGEARLLEKTKGKNAFIAPGQVNGNFAVWSVCRRRCDVIRYNIADKSHSVIKGGGPYDRAPSVAPDGTVYFSRGGKRCGVSVTLVRDPLQGPQQVLVELQKGLDIRDTYAFLESNGTVEIYYERNVCGRPAASDIYKVRELALAGLSVQLAGTGSGIVSSSPPGINCGTDCAEDLERGTKVTLMPGAGSG